MIVRAMHPLTPEFLGAIRLAVLHRAQPFAISEIEQECTGISRDMVWHVLRRMRDEGSVESTGFGRGAKCRHL